MQILACLQYTKDRPRRDIQWQRCLQKSGLNWGTSLGGRFAPLGTADLLPWTILSPILAHSCCSTELLPFAHTSPGFLAWITISFPCDLDNTQSIFHLGFLHSTPWSGVTFYCLCFIFQHFPSAVVFFFCPLMKSLSLLTVFKFSNDTQACSHNFTPLCPCYKPSPNYFPFQDVNTVPISHVPARQCITKLFLQVFDWHCWKDTFHACQSLRVKMPLTCSPDLHGLPWAAAAKFRCGWSMWHSLSYSYYIFLFIQPFYIFHIFHISTLWCKEHPFVNVHFSMSLSDPAATRLSSSIVFLKILFSFHYLPPVLIF